MNTQDMNNEHEWQRLYFAATLETDKTKMEERITASEAAINERLQEFSLNHGGTPDENHAIMKALAALRVLRKEVDNWPSTSP